jgi:hypothetical protein
MPNFKQNDVTKFGVWPNAYLASCDLFLGSDYAGAGIFAFDRSKLLAGDPAASFIYFEIPSTTGITRLGGALPVDMDGLRPPPDNAPGLFMGYSATEYGDAQDALRIYELRPNFARPTSSTLTESPNSPVPVAAFDPTSPEGRADISQPAPGEMLDSVSDRLMYRATYRNFGTRESLVVNHTIRVTTADQPYFAGVRLYELSRPTPTSPFTVNTQSTIGLAGENRWIGSAAQDHQGDLAVGYNHDAPDKPPSIFYTGRLATDQPGTLRAESKLVEADGVQTAFGFRWGDYSGMAVDPVDDCTFWMTGEYFTAASQAQSPFGWVSRIGKFKYNECAPAPRGTILGIVTNAVNGQPVTNALIKLNTAYSRSADTQGNYNALLLPDTYSITVTAHGFIPKTVSVNLANGASVTQNFALTPRAVLEPGNLGITAESCAINSALEPGETVTVNVPLQNTGAAGLSNVTVTLQTGGGVTNPSAPQNYGALPAGGPVVTRPFTFTVSPNLTCGASVALGFLYNDTSVAGNFVLGQATGTPRYALNESFAGTSTDLPAGWTTSVTGEQEPWQKILFEPPPGEYVAFSPETVHPGVNELVSPPVQITNANPVLTFSNLYDLESTFLRNRLYDGGVLEIKIGSGDFQDIVTAGGLFQSGGYDGMIDSCCSNPLGGRQGWSSKSGINTDPEWVAAKIQLPASAVGQNVQFRWRVATDVGGHRTGQWIDNIKVQDGASCSCVGLPSAAVFDFDGDGKTDYSVFHPGDNPAQSDFEYRSANGSPAVTSVSWGSAGDLAVNADFDGDLKSDFAVFRPSIGAWYVLNSTNGTASIASFGLSGDTPVPADYDGDGKADIAVFRPSTGVWYVMKSSNGQFIISQFGLNGDVPVQADYDNDAKADIAVWRPSNGVWYVLRSSDGGFNIVPFGLAGDKPVPGDYDGDKKADYVVFRPSNGNWYLQRSTLGFTAVQFGLNGDKPLQGDFEGDGKRDIAVFRPSNGVWYYMPSAGGSVVIVPFGSGSDAPVPSIYVP